jgi:hypothetical protein
MEKIKMKYAKFNENIVDVITFYPDDSTWVQVPDDVYAGYIREADGTFSPPLQNNESLTMSLTFSQMIIGLVSENWITQEEGIGWLQGILPSAFNAIIENVPEQDKISIIARALRPSIIIRDDPIVVMLASLQQKTPSDVDNFFKKYSEV